VLTDAAGGPFYIPNAVALPWDVNFGFAVQLGSAGGRLVSPRVGVVIPTLLKVRAGTYVEPSRFDTSEARAHGTAGLDVKLIRWNVFGLWPTTTCGAWASPSTSRLATRR
jgi:hypothetical protein